MAQMESSTVRIGSVYYFFFYSISFLSFDDWRRQFGVSDIFPWFFIHQKVRSTPGGRNRFLSAPRRLTTASVVVVVSALLIHQSACGWHSTAMDWDIDGDGVDIFMSCWTRIGSGSSLPIAWCENRVVHNNKSNTIHLHHVYYIFL